MRAIVLLIFSTLMLTIQSCTDRNIIDFKEGVSLPPVENLSLAVSSGNQATLKWGIPANISDLITKPIKVRVEVREISGAMSAPTVSTVTLEEAPTEFVYTIPDVTKTYHFTVKLNGSLKENDPNYSSNIFSLGQTVIYKP